MITIAQIEKVHADLQSHSLYKSLNNLDDMRIFMRWHSFAVWDFMSLLKGLQKEITCVDVPWRPSRYPKDLVRFINEIVLGEESDIDGRGGYIDHFSMYINAMKEVKAPTSDIMDFLGCFEFSNLPKPIAEFVSYNIGLASSGELHKIAAAFFYGRENLIPDIFEPIVTEINEKSIDCPYLKFYLERHIELDGDEHGELAGKCLDVICAGDEALISEAYEAAISSLKLREKMWDYILVEIEKASSKSFESSAL